MQDFTPFFGDHHKTVKSGDYSVFVTFVYLVLCIQLQYSVQALPVTSVVNNKMYLHNVRSRSFETGSGTPLERSWKAPLQWNVALGLLFRQRR